MKLSVMKNLSAKILCTLLTVAVLAGSSAVTASAKKAKNSEDTLQKALSSIGLDYDSENKTIEAANGKGLLGIGFDYDAKQNIFYGSDYCWQRNFGYSTFYDDMAPAFNMNFHCLRFYFDYNGKSWLIQAWKGQYGITTGCELGVYYKSPDREIKHYDCVEDKDRLEMSVSLFRNGENLFLRNAEKHWWLTGFIVFEMIPPQELSMDFTIKFPSKDMLNAFKKSITDDMDITYSTSGKTFKCHWAASPAGKAENPAV